MRVQQCATCKQPVAVSTAGGVAPSRAGEPCALGPGSPRRPPGAGEGRAGPGRQSVVSGRMRERTAVLPRVFKKRVVAN